MHASARFIQKHCKTHVDLSLAVEPNVVAHTVSDNVLTPLQQSLPLADLVPSPQVLIQEMPLVVSDQQELYSHPYLDIISLIVNRRLNSLICEPCKIAIPPAHVQGHLDSAHKSSGFKINCAAFADAVQAMEVSDNLPQTPIGPNLVEFAGLRCHIGLRCRACPTIANGIDAMGVHYSKVHRGLVKPKDFPSVHFQRLHNGVGNSAKFEVHPRDLQAPSSDQILIAAIRAETDEALCRVLDPSRLNARAISPWLLSTKWHLHVAGHILEDLMSLVKPLQHPRLVGLVIKYFEAATDLIDHTDDLVLQHLNTPDPAKT
jgi:hypothetical protein